MLSALQIDPATAQKRLGDGFYEQKLIREQVLALTGNRYLGDYQSDEQQYMALMHSGLTYAKQLNLRPGIALSADQVVSCPSVRNSFFAESQPLFFQRSASWGWFLMGSRYFFVLRCARFS